MKTYLILATVLLCIACGSQNNSATNTATMEQSFNLEESLLKEDYIKIKITKLLSGHLHLNAAINNVAGKFILDTGAGGTVVDEKRSDTFKLITELTNETATGAGGTNLATKNSFNNTIDLDNLKIENAQLIIMNLNHVNNAFASIGLEEVDGIIGADILTQHQAIIDYANLILYLKK